MDDVKKQLEAGANYIDVNAGARIGHKEEDMKWLLDIIQPIATVPLTLDSPDPAILSQLSNSLNSDHAQKTWFSLTKYNSQVSIIK